MKRAVLFTLGLCMFCFASCIEKTNKEMHEMVAFKEHDERLFGWWQSIDQEKEYDYFDDVDFKFISGYRTEEGILTKRTSSTYWYTENDSTLTTLRDVSLFYGNQKYSSKYIVSEDGNIISFKEGDSYTPVYTRVYE